MKARRLHPWVSPENYAAHRRLDPASMPPHYGQWLVAALDAEMDSAEAGLVPIRVNIAPEDLERWCMSTGQKVDARARATLAELQYAQQ
jgi:hypothetical protein